MFSWHSIPFARILIPFIIGIFIALYLPISLSLFIIVGIALFIILLVLHNINKPALAFKLRYLYGVIVMCLLFILGLVCTYFNNELNKSNHFSNIQKAKYYEVLLDDALIEKENFYRAYAKVIKTYDSASSVHNTAGRILLYLPKTDLKNTPHIGDVLIIKAKAELVAPPINPGEYDYKKFLAYQNIYHRQFLKSNEFYYTTTKVTSIYSIATQWRDKALEIIDTYIPMATEGGVAKALLLGFKDDLELPIVDAFAHTGTLHVLAVSGLHAGIIYAILLFLTAGLKRFTKGRYLQIVIILFCIWAYAFITGLSASVLRATIMFSIMAIGKLAEKRGNGFNSIYASAFLLLLYNPLLIVNVGFQLSYMAVLGIVFVQPYIRNWYSSKYWLVQQIWEITAISLAAQLFTFPLGIFYFNTFPNYFLLSNLIIIPITSLILIGLILLIALHWIHWVALLLGKILYGIIYLNNTLVLSMDGWYNSYIKGVYLSFTEMVILYGIMFLCLAWLLHKKSILLNLCLLLTFLLCSVITYNNLKQSNQKILTAHFVKKHKVFTGIIGNRAYIIADTQFLADKYAIKFYLEPYFWQNGVDCNKILKLNSAKQHSLTNLMWHPQKGIQFFDKYMLFYPITEIQNIGQTYLYINTPKINTDILKQYSPQQVMISSDMEGKYSYKLNKVLQKHYGKNINFNKKALMVKSFIKM